MVSAAGARASAQQCCGQVGGCVRTEQGSEPAVAAVGPGSRGTGQTRARPEADSAYTPPPPPSGPRETETQPAFRFCQDSRLLARPPRPHTAEPTSASPRTVERAAAPQGAPCRASQMLAGVGCARLLWEGGRASGIPAGQGQPRQPSLPGPHTDSSTWGVSSDLEKQALLTKRPLPRTRAVEVA